jgi:hypothetical protein
LQLLVKKPWLVSSLIFVLALAYFISMLPRDITWVNVGSDGTDYMIAAKYLRVAHPTGEPLYTLLGAAWIRLLSLFGSEWWRFSLLSAVFSAGTAAVLYQTTRSWLAPAFYLASGVVVSQSTILELYSMVTFFTILGWALHERGHRGLGYSAIGLGLAVHHLAGFMFLGLLAKDYLARQPLKPAIWAIILGLPWYAYIVLANRPPYYSVSGETIRDYWQFCCSQGGLFGGMAVMGGQYSLSEDFRERVWDLTRILLALGPALLILVFAAKKIVLLSILIGVITLYWFADLDPRTYTYMIVPVALAAILIGRAERPQWLTNMSGIFLAALIIVNLSIYHIGGRHLDPHHSAEAFQAQLGQIPPNSVIWNYNRGWEAMTALLYSYDHGTTFNMVMLGRADILSLAELEQAEQEGRLYHAVITDPENYGVQLIPATAELVNREAKEQDLSQYQKK